jgi:hypothetical protein
MQKGRRMAATTRHTLLRRRMGARAALDPRALVRLLRGRRSQARQQIAPHVRADRPVCRRVAAGSQRLVIPRASRRHAGRAVGH